MNNLLNSHDLKRYQAIVKEGEKDQIRLLYKEYFDAFLKKEKIFALYYNMASQETLDHPIYWLKQVNWNYAPNNYNWWINLNEKWKDHCRLFESFSNLTT